LSGEFLKFSEIKKQISDFMQSDKKQLLSDIITRIQDKVEAET